MFSLQGSFKPFSDVVIGMLEGEVGDVVATVVVGAILSDTNGDGGGGTAGVVCGLCGGGCSGAAGVLCESGGGVVCVVTFAGSNVLVELTNGGCWLLAVSAIVGDWVLQQAVLCRVFSDPGVFI